MRHPDYCGNTRRHRSTGRIRYSLLLCLLCSCLVPALFAQPSATPGLQHYRIQPEQSVLTIRVGRAGLLSGLGHEHLISSHAISGTLTIAVPPAVSVARLIIPVQQLSVDDPVELQDAGFQSIPDAQASVGTRDNMLRPEVLDGDRWPEVIVDVAYTGNITGTHPFELTLGFKGTTIPLQIPATVTPVDAGLQIDARFSLEHRQLGLRPYSALGGAIRVAETLAFELHVLAIATGENDE